MRHSIPRRRIVETVDDLLGEKKAKEVAARSAASEWVRRRGVHNAELRPIVAAYQERILKKDRGHYPPKK